MVLIEAIQTLNRHTRAGNRVSNRSYCAHHGVNIVSE